MEARTPAPLANETRLAIAVAHLPPGISKWNRIEHRLFALITMNRRGNRQLVSQNHVTRSNCHEASFRDVSDAITQVSAQRGAQGQAYLPRCRNRHLQRHLA
jgi:hypothetical protein